MRIRQPASRLFPVCLITLAALGACRDDEVTTPTSPPRTAVAEIASVYVVNSLADDGAGACTSIKCTLRDAIISFVSGTIDLSGLTGTITLDPVKGTLGVGKNITFQGPGAANLAVSGGDVVRPFTVQPGVTVTISGLTITEGRAGYGGAIYNEGTLTLDQVAVTSSSGGDFWGGGIMNYGSLTISKSTISGNAANVGGGIATIGPLSISKSTISSNTAVAHGGGIYSATSTSGSTTIVNSTISANSASVGGGIYNAQDTTRIVLSTVTNNSATSAAGGGGVYSYNGSGVVTIVKGSLIWGNRSGSSNTPDDVAANQTTSRFNSLGYNLVGAAGSNVDFALEFNQASDHTGVSNAMLEPLAFNSPGTTATHELVTGSPAIDAGVCTDHLGATVGKDQRDVDRPQGTECDIGAFEKVQTFESECEYTINPKNDQRMITIRWWYATPGVTVVRVTADGRTTTRQMLPTRTGSWTGKVRTGTPTYGLWGGTSRGDEATTLTSGTACFGPPT